MLAYGYVVMCSKASFIRFCLGFVAIKYLLRASACRRVCAHELVDMARACSHAEMKLVWSIVH